MKYPFISLSKLEKLGLLLNVYCLADFMFLWVSFLDKMPTIWFTGLIRQKLLSETQSLKLKLIIINQVKLLNC
jgi:hypothetical protein